MEHQRQERLSDVYLKKHAPKRPPLVVVLPGGAHFCVDLKCADGVGWQIAGELPNITLNPSVSHVRVFHGWIRNGIISDDCEGRKYDVSGHMRV